MGCPGGGARLLPRAGCPGGAPALQDVPWAPAFGRMSRRGSRAAGCPPPPSPPCRTLRGGRQVAGSACPTPSGERGGAWRPGLLPPAGCPSEAPALRDVLAPAPQTPDGCVLPGGVCGPRMSTVWMFCRASAGPCSSTLGADPGTRSPCGCSPLSPSGDRGCHLWGTVSPSRVLSGSPLGDWGCHPALGAWLPTVTPIIHKTHSNTTRQLCPPMS